MAWNVVILGGGFGGFYTARKLEKTLPPASARVTLINDVNFMLYTPLLPGAAGGTLEPRHVVVPLREQLKSTPPQARARHRRRPVAQAGDDPLARRRRARRSTYDQLVVTIGSTSRTLPIPGLEEHALGFKTLSEAIALRNRLVQTLEHAESIDDDEARHSLLTYVFVGAGYAGRRGARRAAGLRRRRARALPALPHARRALRARRGARPADARDLRGPRGLRRRRAAPPRDRDPARHDDRARLGRLDRALHRRGDPDPHGRLDGGRQAAPDRRQARACRSTTAAASRSTAYCQVEGFDDVWAIGDAAAVPDPARPGQPSPPTCQHAIRQGRTVGAQRRGGARRGARGSRSPTRRSACSSTWAATRPSRRRSGSGGAASRRGSWPAPTT